MKLLSQRKQHRPLLACALALCLVGVAHAAAPGSAETVSNPVLPTPHDLQLAQAGPTMPARPNAIQAILYDNGPFVTHPGGGASGADASAVESSLGLTTFGFGHQVSSNNRVADDFTVPAGGWIINAITFYAYQTGSTTTTTFDHVNLQIWDGVPGQLGSNIVWGDTSTNRLSASSFSNVYRVLDTGLTDSNRPIMANTVTVGTTLPAGTYWLDWQSGGTLASGPWAIPVTILGQTGKAGANGMQSIAGTWGALQETGTSSAQDLPFIIEGDLPLVTTEPPRLVPSLSLLGGGLLVLLLGGIGVLLVRRQHA
ncbi:MAG: hypothetical protein KDI69_05265 [Xanthomonadales bacterium]|nr:hypothetical protein [Xanthomonadales bacterium]